MHNGALQKLFDILAVLRGENGCPWDQAQTPDGILSDLVEEVYELQWAYSRGKSDEVLDEMGDVVFVTAFAIALIQESDPSFTLERITSHVYDKIKRRHPHVFGSESATTREEGLAHWNRMKAQENEKAEGDSIFGDVPTTLPPLRMADKIQKRAAGVGFDWDDPSGILAKIREEVDELESVVKSGSREQAEEEIGDLFFSVVNLSRFLEIDGDKSLAGANVKFTRRFTTMEELIRKSGRRLEDMTLDEMDVFWERAKAEE